jgi:hypothetical protein
MRELGTNDIRHRTVGAVSQIRPAYRIPESIAMTPGLYRDRLGEQQTPTANPERHQC